MRKHLKRLGLTLARAAGFFWLSRRLTKRAVRILCYHGIWIADGRFPGDAMFMRPETFRERMCILQARGYHVVSLDEAIDGLSGMRPLPEGAIVITIDDGWASTYTHMLPELNRRGWPATLYCDSGHLETGPIAHVIGLYLDRLAGIEKSVLVGKDAMADVLNRDLPMDKRTTACRKVAGEIGVDFDHLIESRAFNYMSSDELKDAANRGLSIQLHTHRHSIHDGSTAAVEGEIEDNLLALSGKIDRPREYFRHFCYPSGVTSAGAISALKNAGIRSATTTRHGLSWPGDDPYLLPRFLDNGRLSPIEFEAELSGLVDLVKHPLLTLQHWARFTSSHKTG